MTPEDKRKWLIQYVLTKQELLRKEISPEINYVDDKDIDDIKRWTHKKVEEVYGYLVGIIHGNPNEIDVQTTCPWCIYLDLPDNAGCISGKCWYGTNHGMCMDETSNWRKIWDLKCTKCPRKSIAHILVENIHLFKNLP